MAKWIFGMVLRRPCWMKEKPCTNMKDEGVLYVSPRRDQLCPKLLRTMKHKFASHDFGRILLICRYQRRFKASLPCLNHSGQLLVHSILFSHGPRQILHNKHWETFLLTLMLP